MLVVFPIPDGPSTIKPLPGVRSPTIKRSYSTGLTKVYVGTPEVLKTSSALGPACYSYSE